VEYGAISIEPIDFKMPDKVENVIFTSKNTVERVMSYELGVKSCFCVGRKTKALLEQNGFEVIASADYGKELANIIVEKYPDREYTFFCGNRRRDELPTILNKNKIAFEEIQVYKTELNPKKVEGKFDGILFFSPSGVEGFSLENEIKDSVAFCIGNTTATEAKKYTNKIVVAEEPTIESLINKVSKPYRSKLKNKMEPKNPKS
jgi:uroporphyrinogen-III synthase